MGLLVREREREKEGSNILIVVLSLATEETIFTLMRFFGAWFKTACPFCYKQ